MKKLFIFVISLFFLNLNAGNSNTTKRNIPEESGIDKSLINVKFMKQGNMGCSRTCFAMVMHYYNPSITLEMVEREAPRASDGGSQNNYMTILAEQYGFKTHTFPGTIDGLVELLKAGKPVIVAQYVTASEKKSNHDRVVVGFNEAERVLFVHDPQTGENIPYSYKEFLSLWESNVGLDDRYTAILITPSEKKTVLSRKINVDGLDSDWDEIPSISPDRKDDTGKAERNLDIKDLYIHKDGSYINLMIKFSGTPKSDPDIIYFLNCFYYTKNKSDVLQYNFRLNQSPWIQIDSENHESLTDTEWKLDKVFEARINVDNFKKLPDIISIQAGVYDTKKKKFIDMSYPNVLKIK